MTHFCKILILSLVCIYQLQAQRFPVAVTVTAPISAPSTVQSLSMDPGGLMISLTLLDAAEISAQVRLRFTISSNRIGLVSKESFFGGPITLEYNVPLILTGMDLAPLLRPENFTVQGYPEDEFLRQGGTLPEGLYSVCVEVIDFRRSDAILSNQTCGMSWMDELAAPQITGPYDGEIISILDPDIMHPVTLRWQIDLGAQIQPVGYNLYLYEYNEQNTVFGIGPAFYNQRPFFEQEIMATTALDNNYIYGINGERDLLEPGKKYLMRVQAVSLDMNQFFRNDGFSDPVIFQYGELPDPTLDPEELVCNAPEIENIIATDDLYDINWLSTGAEFYSILFYDPDKNLLDSIRTENLFYQFTIPDVSLRYSGVVIGHCSDSLQAQSLPFAVGNFNIQEPIAYDCGSGNAPFPIENRTDIDQLMVGDEILAGDFNVLIDKLSSSSPYSGVGTVVWNFPMQNFLNDNKDPIAVNIEFQDISVNTDYQMYDGMMNITGLGVSLVSPELADFLDAFGSEDIVSSEFSNSVNLIVVDFKIGDAGNIYVNPTNGTITITDPDGNSETFDWDGDDTEIIDGDQVFIVDEDGNVIDGGSVADSGKPTPDNTDGIAADGSLSELTKLGVIFREDPDAIYDFDQVDASAHKSIKALYRPYPILEPASVHHAVYKAILQEQEDVLIAEIKDPNINSTDLEFKTMSGRKVTHEEIKGVLTLTVKGLFTSAEEKIIASHDLGNGQYEVVGVFHLTHLSGDRNANVVLVPLSVGARLDLENLATEIFGPIGVNLNFIQENTIPIPNELLGDDDRLDCGGTGFLSNYTDEQQAVIDHLIASLGDGYREDAYYLFYGGQAPSRSLGGFMPLNRQFGWVFDGSGDEEGKDSDALTALHELGHGVFALEHPWSRYSVDENATTNWLMDYGGGDELTHFYWKQVYDPGLRLYAFQKGEEGASEINPTYFCLQTQTLAGYNNRCFQTPDDQLISLDGYDMTQISFYAREDDKESIHGKLASFIADGTTYSVKLSDGIFNGYHNFYNQSELFRIDKGSCEKSELVIGSIIDCSYSINSKEKPVRALNCDCNLENESTQNKNFNGFISFAGQSYTELVEKTKDLKSQKLLSDKDALLSNINSEAFLFTNVVISDEFKYVNEWVNDKLKYLAEVTGTKYYVGTHLLDYVLNENEISELGNEVFTQIGGSNSGNSLLLFVPMYLDEGYSGNMLNEKERFIGFPQLVDPNNLINGLDNNTDLLQTILSVYAQIPKPYNQYQYKILPGDHIFHTVIKSSDWITGKHMINDFQVWEHNSNTLYKIHEGALNNMDNILSNKEAFDSDKITSLTNLIKQFVRNKDRLLEDSFYELESIDEFNVVQPRDLKEHIVEEHYLDYGKEYYDQGILAALKISKERASLPPSTLYDFDITDQVVKRIVYPAIDVASFLPFIGAIPDAIGLSISTYRGDVIHAAGYGIGVGLSLVVGGKLIGASVKMTRKSLINSIDNLIIDFEQATSDQIFNFFRKEINFPESRARSLADAFISNPDQISILANQATYKVLKNTKSQKEFDDVITALLKKSEDIASRWKLSEPVAQELNAVLNLKNIDVWDLSDEFGEMLVKAGDGGINILSIVRNFDASEVKALSDDLVLGAGKGLGDFFAGNAEGIDAWKRVKHLDPKIRLEPDILRKIDEIRINGKIPLDKFDEALNSHLGNILNKADEINLNKILDVLNKEHVNAEHFEKIIYRLNKYPDLKQDFIDNPSWFETFDDILENPSKYNEIFKETDVPTKAELRKWANGFWKKEYFKIADDFEADIASLAFKQSSGLEPENILTQVSIEVGGVRIRPDYMGINPLTGKWFIGDAKFSTKDKNWIQAWLDASTPSQQVVYPKFQRGEVVEFYIKATDPNKISQIKVAFNITDLSKAIKIENLASLKIFGSEANQLLMKGEPIELIK